VLEKIGCGMVFWGVQIKPGYPLAFGRIEGGPLVFGLPGNPVSAMMTFEQFVRPALRRLTGHHKLFRPTVQARLAETLTKKPGRLHFVRVELEHCDGDIVARGAGNQSSGALRSMTRAHGLLVFPSEDSEIAEGDYATVQVLDDEFFASDTPGF
jgi:molybdopterin molybdotransferase